MSIYLDFLPDELIIELYLKSGPDSVYVAVLNDRYGKLYQTFKNYIYDGRISPFDIFEYDIIDNKGILHFLMDYINDIEPENVTYHAGMLYFIFQDNYVKKKDATSIKIEVAKHLHGKAKLFFDSFTTIEGETSILLYNDKSEWVFIRNYSNEWEQVVSFNFDTNFRKLWNKIDVKYKDIIMKENGYI